MKPTLQRKIFRDFPSLFPMTKPIKGVVFPMYFGCECGDGWYQLIYDLCKEITTYVNNLPETKGLDSIEVLQIKEKYGTLRFYISHGDTCIHKQIQTAEEKSAHICELCGEVGRLTRRGGYFQTLCTKCRMKKKAVLA